MSEMLRIKGAAEGGQPFAPLVPGEWILTEEEEWLEFRSYSSTGWSGHFRDEAGFDLKLPLAGLRHQPVKT